MQSKGISARHELRTAEQYSSSQYEAISKCLDEFCAKVIEANDSTERYIYQQVIFNEWFVEKIVIANFDYMRLC